MICSIHSNQVSIGIASRLFRTGNIIIWLLFFSSLTEVPETASTMTSCEDARKHHRVASR